MAKYLDVLTIVIFDLLIAVIFITVSLAPAPALAQGQEIFNNHCAICHGQDGKGNGPMSSGFNPPPANFTSSAFWQGNVPQKITNAVTKGFGVMPPVSNLTPSQIKAVINYLEHKFKP
jgi:mono/diheme cytochrome c family protein